MDMDNFIGQLETNQKVRILTATSINEPLYVGQVDYNLPKLTDEETFEMFMDKIPKDVDLIKALSDDKLIELEIFTEQKCPSLPFTKLANIKEAGGREKL